MRLTRLRPLGVLLASVAGLGVASAQTDQGNSPPPAQGAAGEQLTETRLDQMVPEAREYLRKMELAAGTVRRLLEQARAARDVVKVLCLNDKLTQIDIATRSARDRSNALESAMQMGDAEKARHEFTVLQVLRDRVSALKAEANQCIGEEAGFIGESEVTVEIDPTIPEIDPDEDIGHDPGVILDSPVLTSPIE